MTGTTTRPIFSQFLVSTCNFSFDDVLGKNSNGRYTVLDDKSVKLEDSMVEETILLENLPFIKNMLARVADLN